jgi:cell division septation protein DedD
MRLTIKIGLIAIIALAGTQGAFSQSKQVREALRKINAGKISEAKSALYELQEGGKEDPGILLLQGALSEDAFKAVESYKKVVASYPKSEWADDAMWRIVQFYAVKGDVETANKELETFKAKYPASEFLSPAMDIVRSATAYHKSVANKKKKDSSDKSESVAAAKPEHDKVKPAAAKTEAKSKATKDESAKDTKEVKYKTWALQVGVFSTVEAAKTEAQKFQKHRYRNEVVEKDIDGKKMFAVVVGSYASKESAEKGRPLVESICGCKAVLYGKK